LAEFVDTDGPSVCGAEEVVGPATVARSDVVPPRQALRFNGARRLTCGGETIAWRLDAGESWQGPNDDGPAMEVQAHPIRAALELVALLEQLLPSDCEEFTAAPGDPVPAGSLVIGDSGRVVCLDAVVEPGVVFDTRMGAVVLAEGAEVRACTRLEGPCFVGSGTVVLGGAIRHSSFGPQCRVHGEVTHTVFIGYANKSHDGFLGHSVLGQWVNLGAGTITSNLKNTYGAVRLDVPGGPVPTGRMFLGSLLADHAKTAIGTLLGAGTVIGAGANVFGGAPPRYVPPFAWGTSGAETMDVEGFVRVASRVLPRRGIALTSQRERHLRALHRRLTHHP
ncbi:MAG: hypothetical protein K6W08_12670, partial [Firmicutes bacterium]|nr:hypothetical protein [Bacillota bacterium]